MPPACLPQIGDVLLGKYAIERVLGTGGMGAVMAATHVELGQPVAIKFMLPELATDAAMATRFLREARAAASIKNDHVCRVLDVGTMSAGLPYIVMEYLEGVDLATLVSRRGPLEVEVAVGYVLEACEAVAEAHARGIVHRDLKPENLFLAERPDGSNLVKVLDFGISKMPARHDGTDTNPRFSMGSPPYMAPEQVRSPVDVDVRTDVWALGVTLYELLAGRPPFWSESAAQTVALVLEAEPPPLRAARPAVPPELERVVLRCLEKDPAARYASLGELGAELMAFAAPEMEVSVDRVAHVLGRPRRRRAEESSPAGRHVQFSAPTLPRPELSPPTSAAPIALPTTVAPPRPHPFRWAAALLGGAAALVSLARGATEHPEASPAASPPSTAIASSPSRSETAIPERFAEQVAAASVAVDPAPTAASTADGSAPPDPPAPATRAGRANRAPRPVGRPAASASVAPDPWDPDRFGGRR